jgi:hypothetical protein
MAGNHITWRGMSELKAALHNLPHHLRGEAANLVTATANSAALEIRTNYGGPHRHTGNLQDHVRVEIERTSFGVRARVQSTARHAILFERGTAPRQRRQGASTGAMWTKTPRPPGFIAPMQRHRRRLEAGLRALLQRAGLLVSGT